MAHTLTSTTKHSGTCTMAFGRYDTAHCNRCRELALGAPARTGWQGTYFARKQAQDAQRTQAIHEHFAPNGPHARGECGPVCTAFDW